MKVILHGEAIRTEQDLHRELAGPLDFGPYYGNNLDALWDRLTTDVERPVELIWKESDASKQTMGDQLFTQIKGLLIRVMEQDAEFGGKDRFVVRFE
ncbi:barstar family protein [Streptomyces sp. NPDC006711]|uniref:barstar family protein n=1 Tax=Streptomyces sp. NPDC006711 TaxID=3364762 RepID=UPI00369A9AD5